ncbi:hypothetical protein JCM11641_008344 [Rhodosporidiobolus odoratus]
MVRLSLQLKATLEGVTDLKPLGEDFEYAIKASCTSCREEHPNVMTVQATETVEIPGSRGEANLVWRCQMCKREHTINFDSSFKREKAALSFEDSEEQRWVSIAVLECRGCEITAFDPRGVWTCTGAESGTVFDEVEISADEPEWTDYDEKAGAGVSVMEVETQIKRA